MGVTTARAPTTRSSSDGGASATRTSESASDGSDPADDVPGPGDELALGEVAPLSWQPKADLKGDVDVSVDRLDRQVSRTSPRFKLDKAMKTSTPYYVHVKVKNTGNTNLAGVELPIFLDNGSDVLVPLGPVTSSFKPCPSQPRPRSSPRARRPSCAWSSSPRPRPSSRRSRCVRPSRPSRSPGPARSPSRPRRARRSPDAVRLSGLSTAWSGPDRSARLITKGSACMNSQGRPNQR